MVYKKLIILLIWLGCTNLSLADTPQIYSTPNEFIANQKTIRVFVDNGMNFGNQASTMNIMDRMRQMGFKGNFEFLYANVSTNKIAILFNIPSTIPDVYFDAKRGITFIKLKSYLDSLKNNKVETVALGFAIQGLDPCDTADQDGIAIDHNAAMCRNDNYANFMQTKTSVEFSPYFGVPTRLTDIDIQNSSNEIQQQDSWKKYFIMPTTTYTEAKNFLQNDSTGINLLKQKPALQTFLSGMENKKFNVFPIYGRTLRFDDENPEEGSKDSPSNILQTILAARYAQIKGQNQPLVIAVFYAYQKNADTILQLIQSTNWGQYETPGAEQARTAIHDVGLVGALSAASVSDPNSIEKINSLKPGQILILSLGQLPKTVFDGLYTHTAPNIWPEVREGAGTFSSLALTGKPHFECADVDPSFPMDTSWTAGFDLITDPTLKQELQNFYNQKDGYCSGMQSWKTQNTYQIMGQLINDASNINSPFSQYFQALKKDALNPENDRINYALEEVIKIINSIP